METYSFFARLCALSEWCFLARCRCYSSHMCTMAFGAMVITKIAENNVKMKSPTNAFHSVAVILSARKCSKTGNIVETQATERERERMPEIWLEKTICVIMMIDK